MAPRARAFAYGAAAALVAAGGLSAGFVPGTIGGAVGFSMITLGLEAAVMLVFYEVGLSEDRERAASRSRSSGTRGGRSPDARAGARSRRSGRRGAAPPPRPEAPAPSGLRRARRRRRP